jgi:hypothetical protein
MSTKVKNTVKSTTVYVDPETGEELGSNTKIHKEVYGKEEFYLVYASLLAVFKKMNGSEINVYAFLLEHYQAGSLIHNNARLKERITKETGVKPRTIDNVFSSLSSVEKNDQGIITKHPLLARIGKGDYELNPRYAFQGKSVDRNKALEAIIQVKCKDC